MGVSYRVEGGIVAWMIGSKITTDINRLIMAIEYDKDVLLLTDKEMRFMSACGLGHQWDNLAKAPVRFTTKQLKHLLAA